MDNVREGKTKRGCKPEEFEFYRPGIAYMVCQACDYIQRPTVDQFWVMNRNNLIVCPICHEVWIYTTYVLHNQQFYENRPVPRLSERTVDVELAVSALDLYGNECMHSYGGEGAYTLRISALPGEPADATFQYTAWLTDPDVLTNNFLFSENILVAFIEDNALWKRAHVYVITLMDIVSDP